MSLFRVETDHEVVITGQHLHLIQSSHLHAVDSLDLSLEEGEDSSLTLQVLLERDCAEESVGNGLVGTLGLHHHQEGVCFHLAPDGHTLLVDRLAVVVQSVY